MSNNMFPAKRNVLRRSPAKIAQAPLAPVHDLVSASFVVLLFIPFFMMSITAFAHDLNRQSSRSPSSGVGTPGGVVDLKWNPHTQALTATVHLSGLQPESSYANHI